MIRANVCNKRRFIGLFIILFTVLTTTAQQIPSRPLPPRLVNDFSNTLSASQEASLERKLVAYNDSTSTQIAVVFVNDLQGTTAADFAYQLGEKWGVGTKENNGIVVLVKPKNDTKGEVFISVGYGLEPYVPDAIAKRIIENEMIPAFKNNDYYSGVNDAIDIIIGLASGAFTAEEYSDEGAEIFILVFFIAMMVVMIVFINFAGKVGHTHQNTTTHLYGRLCSGQVCFLTATVTIITTIGMTSLEVREVLAEASVVVASADSAAAVSVAEAQEAAGNI